MEGSRRVRKRDTYKRLITFGEAVVLVAIELILFGIMWYRDYEVTLQMPFFRRGNWAVIGMYGIIVILFTKLYGGYRVGFFRLLDIMLRIFGAFSIVLPLRSLSVAAS